MLHQTPEQEAVMLQRFARVSMLTLVLAFLAVPAARAETHFSFHIGVGAPLVPVPVAPARYGYVWQPGYYVRTPFGDRWVSGVWRYQPYESRGWAPEPWRARRDWNRDDRDGDRNRRHGDRDRDFEHERGDWRR
jgi:hypothetical protein